MNLRRSIFQRLLSALLPGGTLVAYGSATTRDDTGWKQLPVLKILARVVAWNALPNGRHACFYNVLAGRRLATQRFRAQLREDLASAAAAPVHPVISQ